MQHLNCESPGASQRQRSDETLRVRHGVVLPHEDSKELDSWKRSAVDADELIEAGYLD